MFRGLSRSTSVSSSWRQQSEALDGIAWEARSLHFLGTTGDSGLDTCGGWTLNSRNAWLDLNFARLSVWKYRLYGV